MYDSGGPPPLRHRPTPGPMVAGLVLLIAGFAWAAVSPWLALALVIAAALIAVLLNRR